MRLTQEHVGKFLHHGGEPLRPITVAWCADLTEDLPAERARTGSFFLGFTDEADPGVQIIFSASHQGPFRWMSEYRTGVSRSKYGSPIWSDDLLLTLKQYGLNPERFVALVGSAHELAGSAPRSEKGPQ